MTLFPVWSFRCGNRDIRPIDPPPIVRLSIYEVFNVGSPAQHEKELDQISYVLYASSASPTSHDTLCLRISDVEGHAWICHVDLFPMPAPPSAAGSPITQSQPRLGHAPSASESHTPDGDHLGPSSTINPRYSSRTPDVYIYPDGPSNRAQSSSSGVRPGPRPRITGRNHSLNEIGRAHV